MLSGSAITPNWYRLGKGGSLLGSHLSDSLSWPWMCQSNLSNCNCQAHWTSSVLASSKCITCAMEEQLLSMSTPVLKHWEMVAIDDALTRSMKRDRSRDPKAAESFLMALDHKKETMIDSWTNAGNWLLPVTWACGSEDPPLRTQGTVTDVSKNLHHSWWGSLTLLQTQI